MYKVGDKVVIFDWPLKKSLGIVTIVSKTHVLYQYEVKTKNGYSLRAASELEPCLEPNDLLKELL